MESSNNNKDGDLPITAPLLPIVLDNGGKRPPRPKTLLLLPERRDWWTSRTCFLGPTGSGKTLMARALADIVNVPLAVVDGLDSERLRR